MSGSAALTADELAICHNTPDVLRAVADYHDCQATMADAYDELGLANTVKRHEDRARALRAAALKIEEQY